MDRLKDLWSGQDLINRIVLISGVAVFVWCLIKGQGLYGLVILVVMAFLMISRFNSLTKRRGRLYGTMYFHMPDGELVPRTFEQVKTEYVKGGQSRYADRKVSGGGRRPEAGRVRPRHRQHRGGEQGLFCHRQAGRIDPYHRGRDVPAAG